MTNMGLLGLLNQMPQGGGFPQGGGLLNIASQFPGYTLPWMRGLAAPGIGGGGPQQQAPPVVPGQGQGNFWQGNQFMMPGQSTAPPPQQPVFTPPPAVQGTAAFDPGSVPANAGLTIRSRTGGRSPYNKHRVFDAEGNLVKMFDRKEAAQAYIDSL